MWRNTATPVLDFPSTRSALRPLLAPALALPSSPAVYSAYSEYGEHLFPETRRGRPELGRWRRGREHRATPSLHHHCRGLKAGNTRDLKPRTRA